MKLTIIGASGHGRVVADIAILCGYDKIEFLDDDSSIHCCGKWPVVGNLYIANRVENDLFVAIGNSEIRKRLMEGLCDRVFPILIHPNAVISSDATIQCGSVVMAGAVINSGAAVGRGCIINTSSSIDHDCEIGDYVHISVGVHLCGTVKVGAGTWIGAGSTVSNNIQICGGCMIGAGAVVIRDIKEKGIFVGVPAHKKG